MNQFIAILIVCSAFQAVFGQINQLDLAKQQIGLGINNINLQIATTIRSNNLRISQTIFELRNRLRLTCIYDQAIWLQINQLGICRRTTELNQLKQAEFPALNQLKNQCELKKADCADNEECTSNNAQAILSDFNGRSDRILNQVNNLNGQGNECIDERSENINESINNCQ